MAVQRETLCFIPLIKLTKYTEKEDLKNKTKRLMERWVKNVLQWQFACI